MINFWSKRVEGIAATADEKNTQSLSEIGSEISYAATVGADCYGFILRYADLKALRNGSMQDYITPAITKAHSLGIKVIIKIAEYMWMENSYWAHFVTNTVKQTEFLSDFEWILQKYPSLDGIEIEESEGATTTDPALQQTWRTFKNSFLAKEKAIVQKHHNLSDGSFAWGFNTGSTYPPSLSALGYDFPTIVSQNLVNHIAYQNGQDSLPEFKSRSNIIKGLIGNNIHLDIFAYCTLSKLLSSPTCNPRWYAPGCYNQLFLDEIKYLHDNNTQFGCAIFTLLRLDRPSYVMPNSSTYPGNTIGEMVNSIWGGDTRSMITKTIKVIGNGSAAVTKNNAVVGMVTEGNPISVDLIIGDRLQISTSGTFIKLCDPGLQVCYSDPKYANMDIVVSTGSYTQTLEYYFVVDKKWMCSGFPNYTCVEDILGVYNTIEECQAACKKPIPVLNKIVSIPQMATILEGQDILLDITAIDSAGNIMSGIPITFSGEPGDTVSIYPAQGSTFLDGKISIKVTGLKPGMVLINSKSNSIQGQSVIDVNAAVKKWKCSGAPDYECTLDYNGTFETKAECQAACKQEIPPPDPKDRMAQVLFIAGVVGSMLS
jgi:hypothetical protein